MSRRRIGIGVIGFGWMGQAHSRGTLRAPSYFPTRSYDPELVTVGDEIAGGEGVVDRASGDASAGLWAERNWVPGKGAVPLSGLSYRAALTRGSPILAVSRTGDERCRTSDGSIRDASQSPIRWVPRSESGIGSGCSGAEGEVEADV